MNSTDALARFDGTSISYTYENGWSFTNTFDGQIRTSDVARGLLKEHVEIELLRENLYLVSWVDDEMGPITQILDLQHGTVLAAVAVEGELRTTFIRGTITDRDDSLLP